MTTMLAGRRARLVLFLIVATGAISILAVRAAGSSLSYYTTPEEFAQQLDGSGGRHWRVGGRVVDGTIVDRNGRPTRFEIAGDHGERMMIAYDEGVVPNLFGPGAFVVVEGVADGPGRLTANSVVIKHENAFYSSPPPADAMAPGPAANGR
jgi:cytochrome c-type biogenesis protein CcmE